MVWLFGSIALAVSLRPRRPEARVPPPAARLDRRYSAEHGRQRLIARACWLAVGYALSEGPMEVREPRASATTA